MKTYGYIVKAKDTPMSIARALTGSVGRAQELVLANPQIPRKVVGKDSSGLPVVTFKDGYWKQGQVVRLPGSWDVARLASGQITASGNVGNALGEGCSSPSDCDSGLTCSNGTCLTNPESASSCAAKGAGWRWDDSSRQCYYVSPDNSNEAACKAKGSNYAWDAAAQVCRNITYTGGGPAPCDSFGLKAAAQKAFGVSPDGQWGCLSQCALDASGQTFKGLVGDCTGNVPSMSGCHPCPYEQTTPAKTCTDVGGAPSAALPCCGGSTSSGGICVATPVVTPGKSSWLWWVLGGLGVGAAVLGTAYATGAVGDKKRQKASSARPNPAPRRTAEGYEVNEHGVIVSPGKFENEPTYVPYFWDKGLDGFSDDEEYDGDTPIWVFRVDAEDRKRFPSLRGIKTVRVWEDSSGFVSASESRV